mmetsp:Transcript_20730/g.43216  ORF Transcript_20730/g.43216 Transcript_20730/m.43216 type:complete len:291 (-) Transcript_20730:28-900(-)
MFEALWTAIDIELPYWLDARTWTGYLVIFAITFATFYFTNVRKHDKKKSDDDGEDGEEETPDPPRNFTLSQLAAFTGTPPEAENEDTPPIYLSVKGVVYDVSSGSDFYGPGGGYAMFAGKECGVALAKMSFDLELLNNFQFDDLNFGEKETLNDWIVKFRDFKNYPIVGRVKEPPASADAILSKEEVKKWDGSQPPTEDEPIPRIVVGAGIYYYDCSYGGCPFYGPGGPYNVMAGEDATWALAKMEVGKVARCDLTEKERGVLDGWIKVFERKYVRIGRTGNEVIKDSQS